ncbi:MAG: sulfatase-like hydrolase/transferase, partial [Longimicrobiales bacterium]|nr:sulfatase-like hydrolase/transferase [Longimicrobiales bacterium]
NPIIRTPNVDRLAGEGIRFERAFVSTPICAASRASILTGTYGAVTGGRTNAVALVTPEGVRELYGKVALVPYVEGAPGGDLTPGGGTAPLAAPGRPVPLICIESAWSGLARAGARKGGGWLLNVTNDAWLGEAPRWTRTPAFRQHPRHLVLRSVETGLGALRVGNNGLTGVVSAAGEWTQLLPPHSEDVALATVASLPGPTPYRRAGDLTGPLAAVALAAVGLGALTRRAAGSGLRAGGAEPR